MTPCGTLRTSTGSGRTRRIAAHRPYGKFLPGGELRMEEGIFCRCTRTRYRDTGFTRNWWIGLDIIHTLFVKPHNFHLRRAAEQHPNWTTTRCSTRRYSSCAIMAKIHTVEWTPALPTRRWSAGMEPTVGPSRVCSSPSVTPHQQPLEPQHHFVGGIAAQARHLRQALA